jgi:translation initiation factor IF-1
MGVVTTRIAVIRSPVQCGPMGWADRYIAGLRAGHAVEFRPFGDSMTPRVLSGDVCTVRPLAEGEEIAKGDVVLCRVSGRQYLHLVSAVQGDRVQIANNHGHVNGWTSRANVYGRLVSNHRPKE